MSDRRTKTPTLNDLARAGPQAHLRGELTAAYSPRQLDRAVREGTLVRLLPGVYAGARFRRSTVARLHAASLWAGSRAAIAGPSAAHLHGLLAKPPRTVTLLARPATRLRAPDWITVLRIDVECPTVVIEGHRVVALDDALIQSWCALPRANRATPIIDAVRDDRIDAASLANRSTSYPRISDRRALSRLLSDLAQGAESYLERVAMTRVFNTREFAGVERQVPVRAGGHRYVLDMFDARSRTAVELDGRRFHGDDASRRRDLARDANLASVGITVIRLTFEDVTERPAWCRARVLGAIRARRGSRAA